LRRVRLVTNLAQVSVAVFLLQSASAELGSAKNGRVKRGQATSVVRTIADSAANPLVWAPVLGAIVALFDLPLSPYVSTALNPLAVSAAGVAIFASGLVLAAHQMKLMSSTVIVGSLVSLAVQPALFFAMIKAAGLSGGHGACRLCRQNDADGHAVGAVCAAIQELRGRDGRHHARNHAWHGDRAAGEHCSEHLPVRVREVMVGIMRGSAARLLGRCAP
jgi:hypothetical protein